VVCEIGTTWQQTVGGRTYDIAITVREGMTSNPGTGGVVVGTGTIYAPDITTSPTTIVTGLDTGCFLARGGTKYGIDFETGQDPSHPLYTFFYNASTITNGQAWDYVPVSGWTARPTREQTLTLYGVTDASMFDSYVSSTYGFTDPDFGTFGNAMVDIAKWLFVPSQSSLNFITQKRNEIMAKPPLSWAAVASSTIGGLNTPFSTTSTPVQLIATTTQVDATVTVFDPSAIEAKIPASISSTVKNVGAMLVWGLLFMWIVSLATSWDVKGHLGISSAPQDQEVIDAMDDAISGLADIEAVGSLHDIAENEAYELDGGSEREL